MPEEATEAEVPPLKDIRVDRVRLGDLKLLTSNARFMTHSEFARLTKNIKNDGQLTSVPFAWRQDDGRYLVLSGNHRVQAAIEALGADHEAFVMLCDDPMPGDRRMAIQLAHNAIAGQDDPAVLKELYEGMESVDWKLYAGLDDKTLELMDEVKLGGLSEANLEFQTIQLVFLPEERATAEEAWAAAKSEISSVDGVWLGRFEEFSRTLDALDVSGRSYGVRNIATALAVILEIFERHRGDLAEAFTDEEGELLEERKEWIPLDVLLGSPDVPPGAAMTIQRALKKMLDKGEVGQANLWQSIELWAADYLAGDDV